MERERIIRNIEAFDPELFDMYQAELKKQRYCLSFLPNENYSSPLCSYLRGSLLSNTYLDYHNVSKCSRLENLAIQRAVHIFGSENAIVRLNNISAASRVVFLNFARAGDTIMSFNLRKKEHCFGPNLQFNFVNYSIDHVTQKLDMAEIEKTAMECRPKIFIFSPVNYPLQVDYRALREIAHKAGAIFWADIGHYVGLVAAKEMNSPVPFADVVTFSTQDSLRGPQSAVILANEQRINELNKTIIETGHACIQENVLASLSIALREAATVEFVDYCKQVTMNAKALKDGLVSGNIRIFFGDTESHLVMPDIGGIEENTVISHMLQAGFTVKYDLIPTRDDNIKLKSLRLSSLIPTTRGLKENEMYNVGKLMAEILQPDITPQGIYDIREQVAQIVFTKPLFSEEWLPSEHLKPLYSSDNINYSRELSASNKRMLLNKVLSIFDD